MLPVWMYQQLCAALSAPRERLKAVENERLQAVRGSSAPELCNRCNAEMWRTRMTFPIAQRYGIELTNTRKATPEFAASPITSMACF